MASLISMPIELLTSMLSELSNRDIKSVRRVCKYLKNAAPLRLDRVFLSPHPRDIKVFKDIAADDTFRERIVEIVYDDARLPNIATPGVDIDLNHYYWFEGHENSDGYETPPTGVSHWFHHVYKENVARIAAYGQGRPSRPDLVELAKRLEFRMSSKDCDKLYRKIATEQEKGIDEAADVRALELGLKRFPNLRKLTLTPIAHGISFIPRYETPLIRSFPPGFIYPIPCGWPRLESPVNAPFSKPWGNVEEGDRWRSLCITLHVLDQHPHNITEFVLDVNQVLTGFDGNMFVEPNEWYDRLVSLLGRPGFSRIDFPLFAGRGERTGWPWYRGKRIHRALTEAKDLRYMSFSGGTTDPYISYYRNELTVDGPDRNVYPLRTIFPVEQWANLVHFGLSSFIVTLDDLCSFLSALPRSLRSVTLCCLHFIRGRNEDHCRLLVYMRDELGWRERSALERPKITMHLQQEPDKRQVGHSIDVSAAVENFVYGTERNPFGEPGERSGNHVNRNEETGIERDAFHPANDILFASRERLVALGLREETD